MNLFYFIPTICILVVKIVAQDVIFDANLDIVFILDQELWRINMKGYQMYPDWCLAHSKSRYWDVSDAKVYCLGTHDVTNERNLYKNAYAGVIAWLNDYLDRADSKNTQFAVIYSCNLQIGGAVHFFRDGNFKEKIPGLLESGKNGMDSSCRRRFSWTVNMAVHFVFKENNGHRKNATALIIYVSDCSTPVGMTDSMRNSMYNTTDQFFQKVKGQMFFVCYDYKSPFKENKEKRVVAFKSIFAPLLLKNNQSDRSFIILHENDVDVGENLDYLMPKRSGVIELDCKQYLDCTNNTTPNGSEKSFQSCRWKIAQKPTKNGKNCTRSEDQVEPEIPYDIGTPPPTAAPPILPLLVGIVCALLVLIALLVVALFFVRRKRRRKIAAKNKGVSAVELETETSKQSELSKQSAIGAESKVVGQRSTTGSVAKSVSQRSKISAGLKIVGQSSKVGSSESATAKKAKSDEAKK